ncbi:MAG TPA: tripartite tricarboxylate transporter substrate-binding protein, partial [Burkholderiales bacterium]|nr:tripartite tricarboxylate transporter substrate-binding protein [Burkholderiales bacterium]
MKLALHCTATALTLIASIAGTAYAAEQYPTKSVRFIVPYPPGGGSDITGRAIGVKLNESLGQTFVIDNRPGATGLIGTQLAARAPADGYTLLLADAPHTINALVYSKPPYDAIKDFAPLNLLATSPQALLAHPTFSVGSFKELLAMPRAQTEKLAMGSSGLASGPHMLYEWLRIKTGLVLNHVPYKGGGPSLSDAVAGQIPLVMNAVPASMPFIKSNRL